jgi:hypothetical protein
VMLESRIIRVVFEWELMVSGMKERKGKKMRI